VKRLLLDTHALIWWFADDAKLSAAARTAIADPTSQAFISSASAWEIATKHRIGKFPEAAELLRKFSQLLLKDRFGVLPIALEHALAAGALPGPHRDPFDRMLIAQATVERLQIVTRDPVFGEYGVAVCW
jgi:PIN domain nuclease of toxin-antitoxin system